MGLFKSPHAKPVSKGRAIPAAALGILLLHALPLGALPPATPPKAPICPQVEVVFCVDTTGSMGGLISSAKAKVWSIINGIAGALNGPRLRVGLVAYRDRGDEYITQIFDLTDNLEAVQGRLSTFQANGGGDTPESVNQALADAVGKVSWSRDHVYRVVFLVGDAPPHMDYGDDVKYPLTCKTARGQGIVINAIQCGNQADTRDAWKTIASLGGGGFAAIPQSGGARLISTPYDGWLAEFSSKLLATAVYTGPAEKREQTRQEQQRALAQSTQALKSKDPGSLALEADRGEFRGKAGRTSAGGLGLGREAGLSDLVENFLRQGASALDNLKAEELPEELRKLTPGERLERIRELSSERESLLRQIQDLSDMRDEQLEVEKKKDGEHAFDDEVLDLVRRQASAHCE